MIGVRSYPASQWDAKVPSWLKLWIRTRFLLNGVRYYIYVFPVVSRYSVCMYIYIQYMCRFTYRFKLYIISYPYDIPLSFKMFPAYIPITYHPICICCVYIHASWNSKFLCFQRYFSRGFNMFLLLLVGGLEHGFYDFPYIGNNHPNLTFIFFRGVGIPPHRLYRIMIPLEIDSIAKAWMHWAVQTVHISLRNSEKTNGYVREAKRARFGAWMTWFESHFIPSGKLTVCYWSHGHKNSWFTHENSMVIFHSQVFDVLVYQRVFGWWCQTGCEMMIPNDFIILGTGWNRQQRRFFIFLTFGKRLYRDVVWFWPELFLGLKLGAWIWVWRCVKPLGSPEIVEFLTSPYFAESAEVYINDILHLKNLYWLPRKNQHMTYPLVNSFLLNITMLSILG